MVDREYEPMDADLPNVIILEESEKELQQWHEALSKIDGLKYIITDNPDIALCEWINLYSHDFIPRSIVCRRTVEKQSMGVSYEASPTGTQVAIDGAAFVLYQCMRAVGDAPGMFCLYTEDADETYEELSHWDKSGRVHVLEKGNGESQYNPNKVIEYIISHDEYITQCLAHKEK